MEVYFVPKDPDSVYDSEICDEDISSSYPELVPSSFPSEVSEIELRSGLSQLPSSVNETSVTENESTDNSYSDSIKRQNNYEHTSYNDEMLNLAKQITNNKFTEDKALSDDNNSLASFWITPTSQTNSISGSQSSQRKKYKRKKKVLNDNPEFTNKSFFGNEDNTIMQTRTRTIKKRIPFQYDQKKKVKKKNNNNNVVPSISENDSHVSSLSGKSCKKLYNGSIDYLEEQPQNPIFSLPLSKEKSTTNINEQNLDLFDKVKLSQYSNTLCSSRVHYFSSSSDDNEDKSDTIQTISSEGEKIPELKRNERTIGIEKRDMEQRNLQGFVPCDKCRPAWIKSVNSMLDDVKHIISVCIDFCPSKDRLEVCQDIDDFIAAKKAKCNQDN